MFQRVPVGVFLTAMIAECVFVSVLSEGIRTGIICPDNEKVERKPPVGISHGRSLVPLSNNEDNIITPYNYNFRKHCGRMDRCVTNNTNFNVSVNGFEYRFEQVNYQVNPYVCRCGDPQEECDEYGDCCISVAKVPLAKKNPWRCSKVQSHTWALMVKTCSEENTDSELVSLCRLDSIWVDHYNYQMDLPVLSKNGKLYFNTFCALCNGVSEDDIVKTDVKILCNKNSMNSNEMDEFIHKSVYSLRERYWDHDGTYCGLYIPELDNTKLTKQIPKIRFCGPSSIDECPKDSDPKIESLCLSYTQSIKTPWNYYKNHHCSECNKAADIKNRCLLPLSPKTSLEPKPDPDVIVGPIEEIKLVHDYTCKLSSLLTIQGLYDRNISNLLITCNYGSSLSVSVNVFISVFAIKTLYLSLVSKFY